jgi:Flp pilus assembly protein TadD
MILAGPAPLPRGRRVGEVVGLADLAPTVIDLLGAGSAATGSGSAAMDGRSLVPLLSGRAAPPAPAYSETFYPRYHFGCSELRAMRSASYHFIEAPRPELYDLASDPGELRNLAASSPAEMKQLREALPAAAMGAGGARGAPAPAPSPAKVDDEERERLASLGYVGSTAASPEASWKSLPDPKDRLDIYRALIRAEEELSAKRFDRAESVLREAVVKDPRATDAWLMLGGALLMSGKSSQAVEAYRKTLALRSGDSQAALGLTDALVASGRPDEAIAECSRFLKATPDAPLVHHALGRLLFTAKKYTDAEVEFQEALRLSPDLVESAYDIGAVRERISDPAGAEIWFRKAIAIDPSYAQAHMSLARRLFNAGDLAGAAAEMRKAVQLDPGNASYTAALEDVERRLHGAK